MTETIDYKALYELASAENSQLQEKNIELTEKLEKYQAYFWKTASYADQMKDNMEEVETDIKRKNNKKSINKL